MSVKLEKPDINKKILSDSPMARLQAQGEGPDDDGLYPNISGWATVNGTHFFSHENPEAPEASCTERLNPDGSYETTETSSEYKGVVSKLEHQSHGYVTRGKSSQVDGHDDSKVESTSRSTVGGDSGSETAGDRYDGAGGKRIQGQKEDVITHTAGGKTYSIGTGGDQVTYFACDNHEYIEGDNIASVKGNKYTMVQEGDYGVHVQDKNIDFKADIGKLQIYSGDNLNVNTAAKAEYRSTGDMLITSDSKITIKVGGSEIIITSDNITIKSARIDLNP